MACSLPIRTGKDVFTDVLATPQTVNFAKVNAMDNPLKTCKGCGNAYPATREYFYNDHGRLRTKCKACFLAKGKQRYEANPEARREYSRQWRQDHPGHYKDYMHQYHLDHREELCLYARQYYKDNHARLLEQQRQYGQAHKYEVALRSKRWRAANRERVRENDRRYRDENPQRFKDHSRNWRQRHPMAKLADTRNRRARLKNCEGKHTAKDIERQYERQNGQCFWCSKPVEMSFHVDHVHPVKRLGSNGPENLVISCAVCNLSKGKKIAYVEWQPPNPLKLD